MGKSARPKKVEKDIIKAAEKLLKELMSSFDIEADSKIGMSSYEDAEGKTNDFLAVDIEGEDLGILIGYMGKNLRSLQRIFTMMLNKRLSKVLGDDEFIRAIVDVEGYRDSRKASLESMARRIREEALASGENVDLPAMTGYERRVIHLFLEEFDDVSTESFGEGSRRYVTVIPAAK